MPTATAHAPDGTQLVHKTKDKLGRPGPDIPLEWTRESEWRAAHSPKTQAPWWRLTGRKQKHPESHIPPEGAEIRLDGRPYLRWQRVGRDAAGLVTEDPELVVSVQLEWADIRVASAEAEAAKDLENYREELRRRKLEVAEAGPPAMPSPMGNPRSRPGQGGKA